jgi:23S rRNA G2069 N7-methylase RlmK/C1962 C5-methylase RlmI
MHSTMRMHMHMHMHMHPPLPAHVAAPLRPPARSGGILALASCSSHISFPLFHDICDNAIARARRTATVLGVHGQPADHPYPAACPELRYLKFVTHLLD